MSEQTNQPPGATHKVGPSFERISLGGRLYRGGEPVEREHMPTKPGVLDDMVAKEVLVPV